MCTSLSLITERIARAVCACACASACASACACVCVCVRVSAHWTSNLLAPCLSDVLCDFCTERSWCLCVFHFVLHLYFVFVFSVTLQEYPGLCLDTLIKGGWAQHCSERQLLLVLLQVLRTAAGFVGGAV